MGVRVTAEVRALIQAGTLLLSIVALVQFVIVVRLGILPWRSVVMPAVVTAEIAVFYATVVVIGPLFGFSIGPIANFISAMIRFQSVAVVTTFLSFALYKKVRRHVD